jgi:hypothetical protein
MDNIKAGLAGISGVAAFYGHEQAHSILGSTAITEVTIALAGLAMVGLYLQEVAIEGDFSDALGVSAVGAGSFGVMHHITHGQLGLGLSLSNTSLWLAGGAIVGALAHEYFRGRLDL